jgi:hypothetical protein
VDSLTEISKSLERFRMIKKLNLNCSQEEKIYNITNIDSFAKVLGRMTKLEWLELDFR